MKTTNVLTSGKTVTRCKYVRRFPYGTDPYMPLLENVPTSPTETVVNSGAGVSNGTGDHQHRVCQTSVQAHKEQTLTALRMRARRFGVLHRWRRHPAGQSTETRRKPVPSGRHD